MAYTSTTHGLYVKVVLLAQKMLLGYGSTASGLECRQLLLNRV